MLNNWTNFFDITGAAGAQLIGLLFVVVTLGTRLSTSQSVDGFRAFLTPTLIHFGSVLFQAMVVLAPLPLAWPMGLVLILVGLAGLLGRLLWSVGSNDSRSGVSQALLQPFANYNFQSGWYLTSSPIITADLNSADHNWSVPIGGGGGRIFKLGGQALNVQLQGFDYVERVPGDAHFAIRFQVQFLFAR
jgi:hypothetical protein